MFADKKFKILNIIIQLFESEKYNLWGKNENQSYTSSPNCRQGAIPQGIILKVTEGKKKKKA